MATKQEIQEKDRKKHLKHSAKTKEKEREADGDDDDDGDGMKRSLGGNSMTTELEKAQRELQETLHEEEQGAKRSSFRETIASIADNLSRSASSLTTLMKADSGNDPEYVQGEYKQLAKRKKGKTANSSDNMSYGEQEGEQEETVEQAESEMDGSTLVSGAGKRVADFQDEGAGRRVAIPDHEGSGVDKSQRQRQQQTAREEYQEDFYRSLANNDEFVQVLEASPALAHLADVVAERLADLNQTVTSHLGLMGKSLATLMRSQAAFAKSFSTGDAMVKSASPGVVGRTTDGKGPEGVFNIAGNPADLFKAGDKREQMRKSEISQRIEAAISDGKVDANELARFDAAGLAGLSMDDEMRKSYGIPLSPKN